MKVTPRSHNKDPEYCLLSQERNQFKKKPQQILVFCTLVGPPDPLGRRAAGSARALTTPLPWWLARSGAFSCSYRENNNSKNVLEFFSVEKFQGSSLNSVFILIPRPTGELGVSLCAATVYKSFDRKKNCVLYL